MSRVNPEYLLIILQIVTAFFCITTLFVWFLQAPKSPVFTINGGQFACFVKHTISQVVFNNKAYDSSEWEKIGIIEKTGARFPGRTNEHAFGLPIATEIFNLKEEFRNKTMPQYKSLSLIIGDIVWYAYPINKKALKIVTLRNKDIY